MDNGGEYFPTKFPNYLEEKGITHGFTIPIQYHTHPATGMKEGMVNSARLMILHSSIIVHLLGGSHNVSLQLLRWEKLGSFSIDDGNGSVNVTFKMNQHSFKLSRVYSSLLKMSIVGKFPWS